MVAGSFQTVVPFPRLGGAFCRVVGWSVGLNGPSVGSFESPVGLFELFVGLFERSVGAFGCLVGANGAWVGLHEGSVGPNEPFAGANGWFGGVEKPLKNPQKMGNLAGKPQKTPKIMKWRGKIQQSITPPLHHSTLLRFEAGFRCR